MVIIKGKKKGIAEKKVWNKDYAKDMRIPHADIDFRKYMPPKEKEEKLIKVKTIKRKRKEKKK